MWKSCHTILINIYSSLVLFLSANSSFSTKRCYFLDKSKFTEFLLSIELLMLQFSFTENKKKHIGTLSNNMDSNSWSQGCQDITCKVLRQPLEISPHATCQFPNQTKYNYVSQLNGDGLQLLPNGDGNTNHNIVLNLLYNWGFIILQRLHLS